MLGAITRQVTAGSARILMYHRFSEHGDPRRLDARLFEAQLIILKRHFRPMRLGDIVDKLQSAERLDDGAIAVTVDDGYRDFSDFAVPLLQKHAVPATLYVVSRFAEQKLWLWFDALRWLVFAASAGPHRIRSLEHSAPITLRTASEREALWLRLATHCGTVNTAERSKIIRSVEHDLGCPLPGQPTQDFAAMTWDDLRRLDPALIEVGAHTASHPILSLCSINEQMQEIDTCKQTIETALGHTVRAFCYPNGMPEDFTSETVDIVRASGFSSAVTASSGLVGRKSDRFRLVRISVPHDLRLFRNATDGLWHVRSYLRSFRSTPPR